MSDRTLIYGVAKDFSFAALDGLGAPLDLTGLTVRFKALRDATTRITKASSTPSQVTVDVGAGGTGAVHVLAADTLSVFVPLDATLSYQIYADDGAGVLTPIDSGVLRTSEIPTTYPLLTHADFDGLIANSLLLQLTLQAGDIGLSTPPVVTDARVDQVIDIVSRKSWEEVWGYISGSYLKPVLVNESAVMVAAPLLRDILIDWTLFNLSARRPIVGSQVGNPKDPKSLYASLMAMRDERMAFLLSVQARSASIPGLVRISGSGGTTVSEDPLYGPDTRPSPPIFLVSDETDLEDF